MKIVKKKYDKGGKLAKAVKKNRAEKVLTKKGGQAVSDADVAAGRVESKNKFGSGEAANDKRDAKENIKVANANIAELKKEYQGLTAEERKGKKGKALLAKIQTERDSKRGNSKYYSDLATSKSGKVRVIGSTGR